MKSGPVAIAAVETVRDVKMLADALEKAAAALREVERLMVGYAPKNAIKAETLAEEYEKATKAIREGSVVVAVNTGCSS